jgi:2-oxoglutarate dehydrogenase E1 component
MKDFQYITNSSPAFIENLYNQFLSDANSIDPEMRKFFEGFDFAIAHSTTTTTNAQSLASETGINAIQLEKEFAVYQLILAYRKKDILLQKPIQSEKEEIEMLV